MRACIRKLINDDQQLRVLGLQQGSVYQANAVDSPPAIRQGGGVFIVLSWQLVTAGGPNRVIPTRPRALDVWVYDNTRDYERIDSMISRIKTIMTAVSAQSAGGQWITQIDWEGDGLDGWDDVYQCVYRTASFTVIG